jgi:hypothetical protein
MRRCDREIGRDEAQRLQQPVVLADAAVALPLIGRYGRQTVQRPSRAHKDSQAPLLTPIAAQMLSYGAASSSSSGVASVSRASDATGAVETGCAAVGTMAAPGGSVHAPSS